VVSRTSQLNKHNRVNAITEFAKNRGSLRRIDLSIVHV
jgi:hypothetical protein